MENRLTEEQELIRQSARRLLAERTSTRELRSAMTSAPGYPVDLWRELASLGWMGMGLPQRYGGADGSLAHSLVLLEEMGRAGVPGPYLASTVLAGGCLLEAASDGQKDALLPGLAAGETILALALEEEEGCVADPASLRSVAEPHGGGFRLSGRKLFVPFAHVADHLLLACRAGEAGGLTLFLLAAETPGLRVRTLATGCTDTLCEVALDHVQAPRESIVGEPGGAWPVLQRALARATVAKCAEMVGAAQRVLDTVTAYAAERRQFGRPIGSFQAVQHHCANMLVDLEGARWITFEAARSGGSDQPCPAATARAKVWCNQAYRRIVALGHQVMGGIGYCEEHHLPLFFRHARGAEVMLGDSDFHLDAVASHLFAPGADGGPQT